MAGFELPTSGRFSLPGDTPITYELSNRPASLSTTGLDTWNRVIPPARPHSAWLSLVEQTRPALHLLLRAYVYASEADDEPWHFAVELADLRLGGLMPSDLRWLITQGLLEIQNEDAGPPPSGNGNGHSAEPSFCDGSHFLPTPAGFHRLRDILENPAAPASELPQPASFIPVKPLWDPTLRELRVGEILVKRYRVPAKTQELILNAFQEEDWRGGPP